MAFFFSIPGGAPGTIEVAARKLHKDTGQAGKSGFPLEAVKDFTDIQPHLFLPIGRPAAGAFKYHDLFNLDRVGVQEQRELNK
jgi:hypothetical protein